MRKQWLALFMAAVAAAAWAVVSYESRVAPCAVALEQASEIDWKQPLEVEGIHLGMTRQEVRSRLGEPVLRFDYGGRPDLERWVYRSGLEVMFYSGGDGLRVDEVIGSVLMQHGRRVLAMGDPTEEAARRIRQPEERWQGQFLEIRERTGRVTRIRMTAGERRQLSTGSASPSVSPCWEGVW